MLLLNIIKLGIAEAADAAVIQKRAYNAVIPVNKLLFGFRLFAIAPRPLAGRIPAGAAALAYKYRLAAVGGSAAPYPANMDILQPALCFKALISLTQRFRALAVVMQVINVSELLVDIAACINAGSGWVQLLCQLINKRKRVVMLFKAFKCPGSLIYRAPAYNRRMVIIPLYNLQPLGLNRVE